MKTTRCQRAIAFSLIELLVVVALIGILAVIALPAVSGIQRSQGVNRGGQLLSDSLITARQDASTLNRDVELRIIALGNPPSYRAIQTWVADGRGVMNPLGKIQTIPEGTLISSDSKLSPALTANQDLAGEAGFGSLGTCAFAAIRIRAGGMPDPSITRANNFLTVHAATDQSVPSENFYTVRLDPFTGRITTHRP